MTHETRSACFGVPAEVQELSNRPRWTLFCPGVLPHELANFGVTVGQLINTKLANKFSGISTWISRDALERGVEEFAGRCRPWRTLPPSWWHCALKRGRILGLLEFGSQPSALPDDLLPWFGQRRCRHPLEGSICTTRRAPMRAEVEAHALLVAKHHLGMQISGEGQRGQGRPSPLPRRLQQFGACSRQEAVFNRHSETPRELCNFCQRAPGGRAATCWPLWTPG